MSSTTISNQKRMKLAAALTAILLIFILTLAPAPIDVTAAANIQPELLALAVEQSDEQIRVIIQKSNNEADIVAAVTAMGGTVINELQIIPAVVAKMEAAAAVTLADSEEVRWVSLDAPVHSTGWGSRGDSDNQTWKHVYTQAIEANDVWWEGVKGQGITVAVVDSGITDWDDFKDDGGNLRILDWVQHADSTAYHGDDYYGHGSHVAGIIAGNGALSGGAYSGVAPEANLVNVKISNDEGQSYSSDVVAGLEWILNHKDQYNIRVVNLSLNSSVAESYNTNAIALALEILWFNDIVVVVSVGNNGNDGNVLYPPANDPFVITVGASDDMGTIKTNDDVIASFSDYGLTQDGFMKPDIVAPGTNIISPIGKPDAVLMAAYPDRLIVGPTESSPYYFRMSGTSMASAVTAGAAALLLSNEPNLTPDQVKYRLTHSVWDEIQAGKRGPSFPYLNAYYAVYEHTTKSANVDVMPHEMLAKMALIAYWASENSGGENIDWANVDWDSVNWDNVDWNAVDWESVNWGSVNWGSVNWGSVNWGSVNWGSVNWGSVNWGSVNWGSVNWGSVNWGSDFWD
ncbi:MAG: S8 family serine peptidase [Chloroflexi bacterium]|nr:S8 family serine peptidase [Chloroflexota bacterium]